MPTFVGSRRKQGSSRKTSISASFITLKPLTLWITMNCRKFLKEMGTPDHLTYLLRNLYEGQEAKVRTEHGTTDWFKIGKRVCQGYILSPCLFNFYTELFVCPVMSDSLGSHGLQHTWPPCPSPFPGLYIMWNARLDEAQAGIKIARRHINNLRYVDDTTLMAESEEELKSFLLKVKEESENMA